MIKAKLTHKSDDHSTEGSLISLGILDLQDEIHEWSLEVSIN